MARVGRPRTCDCGECRKCRVRDLARERYQSLSPEARSALVAARDQDKARARDRERYYRDKAKRVEAYRKYTETPAGRAASRRAQKAYADRNPDVRRAQGVVGRALRSGDLVRGPCERADDSCSGRIEAHHDDYSRPLDVRWLCVSHHVLLHREKREGARV